MKGIIYKITNKVNNKSYIGQTRYSLEFRWRQHQHKKDNTYFHNAIKKYGIEKALLDVDANNAASWRTMEALGGHMDLEMESELEGHYKVRFYSIDVEKSLKEYSSIYEPMIVSK